MSVTPVSFWSRIPMLRVLIPLAVGILTQWYFALSLFTLIAFASFGVSILLAFRFASISRHFHFQHLLGIGIQVVFVATGALLVWSKNIENQSHWLGRHYRHGDKVLLTLQEPLVEKPNSYKAIAKVEVLYRNDSVIPVAGNIIIYLKKDNKSRRLKYGSQLLTHKTIQTIRNTGNPGAFDYKRYCLFQDITHQVYLTPDEIVILPGRESSTLKTWIFESRATLVQLLKTYIRGDKETGLAEALLIGYKNDLDKELVVSYSNTGVVHIIAISGLHLGLIYSILLLITSPLKTKHQRWLRFVLIVAGLWAFSLLAGAQPSVLRSALMFSCLALSIVLNRRSSIYNTLALSAFILLCVQPFWLWDVGFQLSYAAVLSILLFFRPIYNWLYFPNKLLQWLWKLAAVSLAAQVLTLPISLYYFHQFPLLFLIANLVAVPLSSLILIGCIILCFVSFFPALATVLGSAISYCIHFMNAFVEYLNDLPFATWRSLLITPLQTIFLYITIAALAIWLLEKQIKGLWTGLISLMLFTLLRSLSFIETVQQNKVIVYNIPKHQALDMVQGHQVLFAGDADLVKDDFLYHFHIEPSRILHRLPAIDTIARLTSFRIEDKNILLIDTSLSFQTKENKEHIEVLILSKNPKIYLSELRQALHIKQIVIDGSVPQWKARLWKKDAEDMGIPCHHVVEKGAFVMNF